MGKCFVIQPFDKSRFDKRFDDHFAPAIRKAGLEPYRVDRDPSVRVPIESIQTGIIESNACLADITTNNPNVWYELGYALASQKEVILVCSEERSDAFPFDVRHLNIIHYAIASGSDFKKLEQDITAQLTARIKERQNLQNIASMSPLKEVEGLSPHETAVLAVLIANADTLDSSVAPWTLKNDMEKAGFTAVAINLSVVSLLRKKMIKVVEEEDYNGEVAKMYELEQTGMQWLLQNQDKLTLNFEKPVDTKIIAADDLNPFADE